MIIDKLENICLYPQIPSYAVDFINNLSVDLELGRYNLHGDDSVNVETYLTKFVKDTKFEAHRNYVDIQLLLSGKERIYLTSVNGLNVSTPYNEERDIEFYSNSVESSDFVTLDGSNFVLIYPHEAHAPQAACENIPSEVKKVVLKLKV